MFEKGCKRPTTDLTGRFAVEKGEEVFLKEDIMKSLNVGESAGGLIVLEYTIEKG